MHTVIARAARRGARMQIKHLSPVPLDSASAMAAKIYAQVEEDFGMLAPPVILHAPAPELLAASWMMLRETLLADGIVDRAVREIVATAVSLDNTCPYCIDVHSATLHGLSRTGEATAMAAGRLSEVTDPGLRAIAGWAQNTARFGSSGAPPLPFPAEQLPELAGVAVVFHYLNRVVNVFLAESPFPPQVPPALRPTLKRLAGRFLRPAAQRPCAPGASLDLLPDTPLPSDLSWAAASPHIAHALARGSAVIDDAGRRAAPDSVRDLVTASLARWDGEPPGLSRGWAEDAISILPAPQRPAGRLALLTAMASYQVDQPVIDDFRRDRPDDVTLIGLTSWAAMAAARWVGSHLLPGLGRDATTTERTNIGERTET